MAGARVVVIEDEQAIRRGIADALRSSGYQVAEAADGNKGLDEAVRLGATHVHAKVVPLQSERDRLDHFLPAGGRSLGSEQLEPVLRPPTHTQGTPKITAVPWATRTGKNPLRGSNQPSSAGGRS